MQTQTRGQSSWLAAAAIIGSITHWQRLARTAAVAAAAAAAEMGVGAEAKSSTKRRGSSNSSISMQSPACNQFKFAARSECGFVSSCKMFGILRTQRQTLESNRSPNVNPTVDGSNLAPP